MSPLRSGLFVDSSAKINTFHQNYGGDKIESYGGDKIEIRCGLGQCEAVWGWVWAACGHLGLALAQLGSPRLDLAHCSLPWFRQA